MTESGDRATAIADAVRAVDAATTVRDLEGALRGLSRRLQQGNGAVRFSSTGVILSVESIRALCHGVLDAMAERPDVQLPSIYGTLPIESRDTFAVTRVRGDGGLRVAFNPYWLDGRMHAEFLSALRSGRGTGAPSTPRALAKHHVTAVADEARELSTTRADARSSEPSPTATFAGGASRRTRYGYTGPLDQLRRIDGLEDSGRIAECLGAALGDLLERDVHVDLGPAGAADIESLRDMSRGLVEELLAGPPAPAGLRSGPVSVTLGALPEQYADAYAVSIPNGDGTHRFVLNERWFGAGRRPHLLRALAADARGSGLPADPVELARRHARRPGRNPQVSASPRQDYSPQEWNRRIQQETDLWHIQHHLAAALTGATGEDVVVALAADTSVASARDISDGLIRAAVAAGRNGPKKIAGVTVLPLGGAAADDFARTVPLPDGSSLLVFNTIWHTDANREVYLRTLREMAASDGFPASTPAELAALRFDVPGTGAFTVEERIARMRAAPSLDAVEQEAWEAFHALGMDVDVDLQGRRVDTAMRREHGDFTTSQDSIVEVLAGVLETAAEFPGTRLDRIEVEHLGTDRENVFGTVRSLHGIGRTITFNARWHRVGKEQEYQRQLLHDRTLTENTRKAVGGHEMAHAVSLGLGKWRNADVVPGHPKTLRAEVLAANHVAEGVSWARFITRTTSPYAATNDEELTGETGGDQHEQANRNRTTEVVQRRLKDAHAHLSEAAKYWRGVLAGMREHAAATTPPTADPTHAAGLGALRAVAARARSARDHGVPPQPQTEHGAGLTAPAGHGRPVNGQGNGVGPELTCEM
ncbi:MAG: hypothetical protein HOV68_28420 [Streptomycetaceae bacterium]|nr:hypothetical protein [Streptomycetaceae bacterium]